VLAALNATLADAPALLRAALLLAAWAGLTGALHLDGLADSADAWVGGLGNRRRTLDIMKDPYCGPAAVVTLTIVLLIKLAALHALGRDRWPLLAAIPMLARTTTLLLFLTTPYVRPGGIGATLASHVPRASAMMVIAVVAILATWIGGTWLLLILAGVFLSLRALMMSRIGGTTGDTAGATIELAETAMLATAALL